MLTIIRDRASGWVAGIIVGALIISFAFWGVSSYFGSGDVYVASVNGIDIKLQTFQRSFYTLRKQLQSVFGDALSLEQEELIKDQALQKLVETELVNQIIDDSGLRVSNKKVVDTIKNLEVFRNEDGFDRTKYERSINSLGMDPIFFEAQLRMDLLSEQLQAGLSDSLFVLESELQAVLRLKSQTRDLTYSILSLGSFIDDNEIDDSEIEAFYKANPGRYADPEKVKIAYLELDIDELAKTVTTDEDSLINYYIDNKDNYDVAEQRSVSKLFVKSGKDATDEDKVKAKEVIDFAMTLVNEGKDFEEVIEKFTEEGKGTLEFSEHIFMAKGIMGKEIDEFLFSSDEGAISDSIKTENGFNIIKIGEIKGGPKNKFENVAEQVEHDYRIAQAALQFFELADQLTNLSYEHSDTLEIAAEGIGQEIIESDYFSRDSITEGVISNPKIISNSFDPELISSGQNSEAIELSDNHIVVLSVLDHKVSTTKALDDVRDEVITDIRLERAAEKIIETGEAIVKQLESGVSPDSITSEKDIEWSAVEKVKRDDVKVNRAVLRNAFQAGIPGDDKPIISSNRLGSGDYAIIIVTAAYYGDLDEIDDQLGKSTDLELRRTRGTSEWKEFLKNAKGNADIIIYKDNI
ncbi:MAG: SurA N-terminal domain-containing protein [Proteobacteria bacterium]|nr:SurA N-terminal domain-containing protein [Pseudomonadota bacterium]